MSNAISSTGVPSYEEYLKQQSLRNPSKDLGKNEFMQLLAAQMSHQDPLEPSTDTEFIAQLAQFSSLEQMQNLNTTMTAFQAYNLAGKYVHAEVTFEDGSTGVMPGIVDRIINKNGEMYAQIGDYIVKTSAITEVYDGELFGQGNPLLDSVNLIGKNVRAKVEISEEEAELIAAETGEDAPSYKEVSGVVTRVAVEDGIMVAYIQNGDETLKAPVANIYDIEDASLAAAVTPKPEDNTPVINDLVPDEENMPTDPDAPVGETVPPVEIETPTETETPAETPAETPVESTPPAEDAQESAAG